MSISHFMDIIVSLGIDKVLGEIPWKSDQLEIRGISWNTGRGQG
jgi:hypothetical protein